MKNAFASSLLVLFSLFVALPAHAVKGRPTAFSFLDPSFDRHIYAFIKGDNGHLVSNHFDGTSWSWTDHGLPEGSASINSPKAITYVDDNGNRRIYVFAIDNTGHLAVLFHKGAGYTWQWSKQGGPFLTSGSLSATTFIDDAGVRRIYAFAFRTNSSGPGNFRLVSHFWNGNAWNWQDMATLASQPTDLAGFTDTTSYTGNDGRHRIDVFHKAGTLDVLLRHSWVAGAWNLTNLNGQADKFASTVNYTNSSGYRQVDTFVRHPAYQTVWDAHGGLWSEIGIPSGAAGKPQGFISATSYKDGSGYPRIDLFSEWDKRLYMTSWVNLSWQPWQNLGRPASSQTEGVENAAAITYLDSRGGDQYTWVFMTGAQDHLYVNFWNGSSWQWYDRGNP